MSRAPVPAGSASNVSASGKGSRGVVGTKMPVADIVPGQFSELDW